jgi:hypothetical protein
MSYTAVRSWLTGNFTSPLKAWSTILPTPLSQIETSRVFRIPHTEKYARV